MQDSSSSGSSGSSGTATRECIVVVVKAYNSPKEKTFRCALKMMERTTNRVVVVSCLTLIPHVSGGMQLPVASVKKEVRDEAVKHQLSALSFCVRNTHHLFHERQVDLCLLVKSGKTNNIIVNAVATELRPRWIIVDSSLLEERRGRLFRERLEQDPDLRQISNLAFIWGGSSDPTFVSSAYFPGSVENVDINVELNAISEVTVEEHTDHSSSVACGNGLFTFWKGSSSRRRRTITRGRDRASFQARTARGGNANT